MLADVRATKRPAERALSIMSSLFEIELSAAEPLDRIPQGAMSRIRTH